MYCLSGEEFRTELSRLFLDLKLSVLRHVSVRVVPQRKRRGIPQRALGIVHRLNVSVLRHVNVRVVPQRKWRLSVLSNVNVRATPQHIESTANFNRRSRRTHHENMSI